MGILFSVIWRRRLEMDEGLLNECENFDLRPRRLDMDEDYPDECEDFDLEVMQEKGRTIESVIAREIVGTYPNPAMEVVVGLCGDTCTTALLRGGITDGTWKDASTRRFAIDFVKKQISPILVGREPTEQTTIDKYMVVLVNRLSRRSNQKKLKNLLENVIWGVSAAVCKAGAEVNELHLYKHIGRLALDNEPEDCEFSLFSLDYNLPTPIFNVTDCGSHLENKVAMQHLIIIPGENLSFFEAFVMHKKLSVSLSKINTRNAKAKNYVPSAQELKNGLGQLKTYVDALGYTDMVSIGVDAAASKLYRSDKTYCLEFDGKNIGNSGEALKNLYLSLVRKYPIVSIEDPFHPNDSNYSSELTQKLYGKVAIVMKDDRLLTDRYMLAKEIRQKTYNALLLEMNHLRTVTECIDIVTTCKEAGWKLIMSSHASCQMTDTFVADLSVALDVDQIKIRDQCLTMECDICSRLWTIFQFRKKEYSRLFRPFNPL